jgi:SNF2 family DNA or RNA helicase
MLSIENNEIQVIPYTYNIILEDMKILFDPLTQTKTNTEYFLNIKTRGGMLSDDMGLGKTITTIGLIICNPCDNNIPNFNINNKINSKATLIICPSHLAKQWENEVKKCCNLKVITILSKTEYYNYIFNDFIESDIIITSHQFIMNLKFYQSLYYKQCSITLYNETERQLCINKFLLTKICDLNFDELKKLSQPMFEFFNFHLSFEL